MSKSMTKKFCPVCQGTKFVRVIPFESDDDYQYTQKDRNFYKSYADKRVHFFARKVRCQHCEHVWATGEIALPLVFDLVEDHNALEIENKALISEHKELVSTNLKLEADLKDTMEACNAFKETLKSLSEKHAELLANQNKPNAELTELKYAMSVFMKHALAATPANVSFPADITVEE